MTFKSKEARQDYARRYWKQDYDKRPEYYAAKTKKSNDSRKEKIYSVQKKRIQRRKYWLDKWKCTKGCMDCGYNEYAFCLEFDHRNPIDKIKDVAVLLKSNLKDLFAEIRKCDLVCVRCHRIRTHITKRDVIQEKRKYVRLFMKEQNFEQT